MNSGEIFDSKLWKYLIILCTDVIRRFLRFSLGLLSSTQGIETLREDEMTVANQIKGNLSARDALQFDKLHNDLKDGVRITFSFSVHFSLYKVILLIIYHFYSL